MLNEIRAKLDQLRGLDVAYSIFGSEKHRYSLNPPLTEARVAEIEGTLGMRLPEQYREYVVEFADGGAGPYYGVTPLAAASKWSGEYIEYLKRPFVAPTRAAEAQLGRHAPGSLLVCNMGCGSDGNLIITGTERGYVWIQSPDCGWSPELVSEAHFPRGCDIDGAMDAGIASPASLKLQFLDWYNKWLDDSLKRIMAKSSRPEHSS